MRYLTCSTSDKCNDVVNSWYMVKGIGSTLAPLLQVVVSSENDNEEDPDGYWHP